MMKNKTLNKSIYSLAHPLTIFFLVLLLVNDHVFRWMWPSWLTGKLGDFAWLVFAPFMLTLPLSLLAPSGGRRQSDIIGFTAISLTGLTFSLAKTLPSVHNIAILLLEELSGYPSLLKRDPTDLITLPALLITWMIWKESQRSAAHLTAYRGLIVLPLAIFATIANSPVPPDLGITCLYQEDGKIIAPSYEELYESYDGGLTWLANEEEERTDLECREWGYWDCCKIDILTDPDDEEIQYRFNPGESIERSEDGGLTWTIEFELQMHTDAQKASYLLKHGPSSAWLRGGPIEAVIDISSGQVVTSMGLEGALVRSADGQWDWVSIGPYQRIQPRGLEVASITLSGEIVLALVLALLLFGTTVRHLEFKHPKEFILTALAWLVWVFSIALARDPTRTSTPFDLYPIFRNFVLLPVTFGFVLLLVFTRKVVDLYKKDPRTFILAAIGSFIGAVLFMLPYFLWSQGILPRQSTAKIIALLLSGVMLLVVYGITRRLLKK
jgi:hypothetical protein